MVWNHTKSSSQRGYGSRWRRKREAVLMRDNHLCQVCAAVGRVTAATEVDHKKNKASGGDDHIDNLQSICEPCHYKKTQQEAGLWRKEGKVIIGVDGWPIDSQ